MPAHARPGRPWITTMTRRDPGEGHRPATSLELLFDLTFVVAVAQAAKNLEHAITEDHTPTGTVAYLMTFAAIWWAWMLFTWFANFFDTDDVPYRLLTIVQIAGSLGLAAGIPAMANLDFRVAVISYVVMRTAYIAQWIRARRHTTDPLRTVATRTIILNGICQLGWIAFLAVPKAWIIPAWIIWFAFDIATPALAGWDARTGGHTGHLVERYGLFTIIVLGETITAATMAITAGLDKGGHLIELLVLAGGGLVTCFAIWWLYFDYQTNTAPAGKRWQQYLWGYGHLLVFAAVAAVGAGLALAAEHIAEAGHHTRPSAWILGGAITVPAAVFLGMSALFDSIAEANCDWVRVRLLAAGALAVLAATALAPTAGLPLTAVATGAILAVLVAIEVTGAHRRTRTA
ncbi:low temperature requirement protein A [Phytomonospora endophytica]|uniref:Low temperature requirement protein LtrA n=1 Tax=Phytomonospora endophytica TaxID=714109 RepID=A0A841FFN7_9ACTN|nr:low temperature requirement protein A [Phytomonospora endophytica]MBB6033813.1 low temperature requirement protein LtrA [Phytomonospora endophytica]GIG64669.1 hypothetical protein Pen01_09640 [Phytomonospora endophytica]